MLLLGLREVTCRYSSGQGLHNMCYLTKCMRCVTTPQRNLGLSHQSQPMLRHCRKYHCNINKVPDFSAYTHNIHEIAPKIKSLSPYSQNSPYLNPQHYYQNKVLLQYAKKKSHPMSLNQLAYFGHKLTAEKILISANFVREELPLRIAHKLQEMQQLPFHVVNNFHLREVYESYYNIFDRFRRFPKVRTLEENDEFCLKLREALTDFNLLNLPNLMMGALECRIFDLLPQRELDELTSSLLRARISRRLIVEEHIALTDNFHSKKARNFIGDIFKGCNSREYLTEAWEAGGKGLSKVYGDIPLPQLVLEGDVETEFQFLPTHLRFLFGELMRNSMEATVMQYLKNNCLEPPHPIVVTVINNTEDVSFRISDRGGGIPVKPTSQVWSFGKNKNMAREALDNFHKLDGLIELYESRGESRHTLQDTALGHFDNTKLMSELDTDKTLVGLMERPVRNKLGVGLATCKVYADYWNGDLVVHSLDGFGTDTFLKLGKLGHHTDKLQLDRV